MVQYRPSAAPEIGIEAEWEIEAQDLQLFNKLGEGEFGEVNFMNFHFLGWGRGGGFLLLILGLLFSVLAVPVTFVGSPAHIYVLVGSTVMYKALYSVN